MILQNYHIDLKHHNFTTNYHTLLGIPDIEKTTELVFIGVELATYPLKFPNIFSTILRMQ